MAPCPVCARPVAVARPRCLYCGAELPAESVTAAVKGTREVLGETVVPRAEVDRVLLILDPAATTPETLARVLAVSVYEANQLRARGSFELLRAVPPAEADRLAAGLREAGLAVFPIAESEARLRPVLVRGGARREGVLHLRTEAGDAVLGGDDLLLVVRGPIAREYQTEADVSPLPGKRTKIRAATLATGYLFHLHRKQDEPPLELDPGSFEFGYTPDQGSLLELGRWVESLDAPSDDTFKKYAPALAPAAKVAAGVIAPTRALVHRAKEGALVLDNVEQFRFYSGWRGAVERRRG